MNAIARVIENFEVADVEPGVAHGYLVYNGRRYSFRATRLRYSQTVLVGLDVRCASGNWMAVSGHALPILRREIVKRVRNLVTFCEPRRPRFPGQKPEDRLTEDGREGVGINSEEQRAYERYLGKSQAEQRKAALAERCRASSEEIVKAIDGLMKIAGKVHCAEYLRAERLLHKLKGSDNVEVRG